MDRADEITGSGTPEDPYVVHGTVNVFCSCLEPERRAAGVLIPGRKDKGVIVAMVAVREEEKVQVARQIGGEVVATVMVNDELRKPPKPDEGVPVNPGDVVQLISTVGTILGEFTFMPKGVTVLYPDTTPVIECPSGQPATVALPGNYTGTSIEDIAVTTGPEKAPAVTAPKVGVVQVPGQAPATGGLEPVLKTGDTVIAAGQLDNSAIGSNAISVTDKNTGAVLGQTQIDMWRLVGASLNPPVVDKGGQTDLRLDVFGPPDLTLEVTATAGDGLTPKQVTATAPIGVLQKQGLGAFTATKSGTHSVSVKALPVTQVVQKGEEAGKSHPREYLSLEELVEEARRLMDKWENFEELTPEERNLLSQARERLESKQIVLGYGRLPPEEASLLWQISNMMYKEELVREVEDLGPITQTYIRLWGKLREAAGDFNSARKSRDRAAMERARQEVERLQRSLEYLELRPENRAELERDATRLLERMDVELGQ